MLNPPHAAAGYTGAGMAYMEEPHRIDYFVRHRWVDCPARMLKPLLMRALETSRLFEGVVSTPTVARFDLQLNTELLRLIQVFESGESRIELSARFSLLDTHQRSLLFNEVVEITEPTTSGTPYAGVVAANRAVARLLEALQGLLRPYAEARCNMTGSHDG
jgi:cholesterol transport system auxiliary component